MTTTNYAPAPLSRERILDCAEQLIEVDGADAFSMRRVASELGVTPMALYKWFRNRDDLVSALATRAEISISPARSTGTWSERVIDLALRTRAALRTSAGVLAVEGAKPQIESVVTQTADEALLLMMERGYEGDEAVRAYRVLFWSIVNFFIAIDIQNSMPAAGGSTKPSAEQLFTNADFEAPIARSLLQHFHRVDKDEFFVELISTVVAGLENDAPR